MTDAIKFLFENPNRYLFVRYEQWKQQNSNQDLFKVTYSLHNVPVFSLLSLNKQMRASSKLKMDLFTRQRAFTCSKLTIEQGVRYVQR